MGTHLYTPIFRNIEAIDGLSRECIRKIWEANKGSSCQSAFKIAELGRERDESLFGMSDFPGKSGHFDPQGPVQEIVRLY